MWRPELVRLPKMTRKRRWFRAFGQGLVKLIVKTSLNVTVEGLENVPKNGPLMIVINHIGDSDLPALISVLPSPPDALGGIELYEVPILGKLMDWYGVIWLHRGRSDIRAIRAALDVLRKGVSLSLRRRAGIRSLARWKKATAARLFWRINQVRRSCRLRSPAQKMKMCMGLSNAFDGQR